MKTYSIQSDIFGDIDLPKDIETFEEAVYCIHNEWANCGEIRLIEKEWRCVSQTPHTINTDYKRD